MWKKAIKKINLAAHESETSNKFNHYIPINFPFFILFILEGLI